MPEELLLVGPRDVRITAYEETKLNPDEIRAEAVLSGISHGTELSLYRGTSRFMINSSIPTCVCSPVSERHVPGTDRVRVGQACDRSGSAVSALPWGSDSSSLRSPCDTPRARRSAP